MKAFRFLDKCLLYLSEGIVVTATAIMILSAALQIISRMVFSHAVGWTDELCRTTAVWATMFAAAIAVRTDSHVTMSMLRDLLPEKLRRRLAKLCTVLVIVFAVFTLIYGAKLSASSMVILTPGLGIKRGLVYLCIPVSSAVTIFNGLLFLFSLPEKFDRSSADRKES